MVTISSQDENFFVSGFKQDIGIWLGITDELTEGVWEWVTGEPVVFTNWNEGQPDDFGTGEDYGVIEQDELWNDIGLLQGNDQQYPYICESPQNVENDGPSKAIFNASFYQVFYTAVSWEQAKFNCESLDMHLVTISSVQENNLVRDLTLYVDIWLGFTDKNAEGVWEWITGEPVSYTNWEGEGEIDSEPNDAANGEDYAEMQSGGRWNDNGPPSDIDLTHLYVCESTDRDEDSIPDHIEIALGLDPNVNDNDEDLDGDNIPNLWEYEHGLDLSRNDAGADNDFDGLSNLEEYILGSSPTSNDTDLDGMLDGWEVAMGLNILEDDSQEDKDGDLISNLVEYQEGSNANNFWDVPIIMSEFPFIFVSLPIILFPTIILTFLSTGVVLGHYINKSKLKKLINKTGAPDYYTAQLVEKGEFVDYEQFEKARKLDITTIKEYEFTLELKNRQENSLGDEKN